MRFYTHGRSAQGTVVTYKRSGEPNHNKLPTPAPDVTFPLADESAVRVGLLLSKFARLIKASDARMHWGGDWPKFKDRTHFYILNRAAGYLQDFLSLHPFRGPIRKRKYSTLSYSGSLITSWLM